MQNPRHLTDNPNFSRTPGPVVLEFRKPSQGETHIKPWRESCTIILTVHEGLRLRFSRLPDLLREFDSDVPPWLVVAMGELRYGGRRAGCAG